MFSRDSVLPDQFQNLYDPFFVFKAHIVVEKAKIASFQKIHSSLKRKIIKIDCGTPACILVDEFEYLLLFSVGHPIITVVKMKGASPIRFDIHSLEGIQV